VLNKRQQEALEKIIYPDGKPANGKQIEITITLNGEKIAIQLKELVGKNEPN